jgi:hypothetical protein
MSTFNPRFSFSLKKVADGMSWQDNDFKHKAALEA